MGKSPLRYTRLLLEACVGVMEKMWTPVAIGIAVAGIAVGQVPPEIAKQLVTIGRGVCVPYGKGEQS